MHFILLKHKRTWLEILLIGLLLAIGISAFPRARCALGQCSVRNQWCNPDCSQPCSGTGGIREIKNPGLVFRDAHGGTFCSLPTYHNVGYRCEHDSDCNATWIADNRWIDQCGNHTCVYIADQTLPPHPVIGQTCRLRFVEARIDCCLSGGIPQPTPRPRPCTPTYYPPTISLDAYSPPYPLVIGQDPDDWGVDIIVNAEGGSKSNHCDRGEAQKDITTLSLDFVELSNQSRTWITTELERFYPGAHVLDSYPLHPAFQTQLNGTNATLTFHFDPLDPGVYEIQVSAVQEGGGMATATLDVPVYMLETTITY